MSCVHQIDLAYDILLMESMKRRLSGETEVARSVRFADVPQPKKKSVRLAMEPTHLSPHPADISIVSIELHHSVRVNRFAAQIQLHASFAPVRYCRHQRYQ